LTDKNQAVVRKVLTPGVWNSVVNLPVQMMREARADLPHAPIKAALTAQIAVAIAILSFAPIRLGNLVAIKIDENLIKPGGLWARDHAGQPGIRQDHSPADQV
jgi:hypothetical protein